MILRSVSISKKRQKDPKFILSFPLHGIDGRLSPWSPHCLSTGNSDQYSQFWAKASKIKNKQPLAQSPVERQEC